MSKLLALIRIKSMPVVGSVRRSRVASSLPPVSPDEQPTPPTKIQTILSISCISLSRSVRAREVPNLGKEYRYSAGAAIHHVPGAVRAQVRLASHTEMFAQD